MHTYLDASFSNISSSKPSKMPEQTLQTSTKLKKSSSTLVAAAFQDYVTKLVNLGVMTNVQEVDVGYNEVIQDRLSYKAFETVKQDVFDILEVRYNKLQI